MVEDDGIRIFQNLGSSIDMGDKNLRSTRIASVTRSISALSVSDKAFGGTKGKFFITSILVSLGFEKMILLAWFRSLVVIRNTREEVSLTRLAVARAFSSGWPLLGTPMR